MTMTIIVSSRCQLDIVLFPETYDMWGLTSSQSDLFVL